MKLRMMKRGSCLIAVAVITIALCAAVIAFDHGQEAPEPGQAVKQTLPAPQIHDTRTLTGREDASPVMLPPEIAASRATATALPPDDFGEAIQHVRATQSRAQQAEATALSTSPHLPPPAQAMPSLVDAVNAARPSLADDQRSASVNPFNVGHD